MSAKPKAVSSPKNAPVKQRGRVRQGLAWCALLLGLSLLGWGLRGEPHAQTPLTSAQPLAATMVPSAEPQVVVLAKLEQPEDATHGVRRIETIRVGQRVLGRNPLREQVEQGPEPEPKTWRLLHLEMRKGNGRQLYVDLLRPLSWIEQQQALVGGRLHLDQPEMGAQGWAKVTAIDPCPSVEPGAGQVVTGRYKHEPDDNILDVRVAGQEEPIGVTDTHPWWSEDRQAFVAVGQLRVGERVRTGSLGLMAIASIQHRPREAWVYNLEVQGEHVYQVADVGVLVHNNNGDNASNNPSPRTPVGRAGQQHSFPNPNTPQPRNSPTTISGRQYSGHAIDRMQERGFTPSVVENTIQHGQIGPGSTPGTVVRYDPINNVSAVVDQATGRVVTVSSGDLR